MNITYSRNARTAHRTAPLDSLEYVRQCAEAGESIVARIIRERDEARAKAAARRRRIEARLIIANLILWPLAAGLTVATVQAALNF